MEITATVILCLYSIYVYMQQKALHSSLAKGNECKVNKDIVLPLSDFLRFDLVASSIHLTVDMNNVLFFPSMVVMMPGDFS